jgi:ribosomal protein S18 acetylase RimI-like enzyme
MPRLMNVHTAPIAIRMLGPADLGAYKTLRDLLLASYPEAFTSDASIERQRAPETYLARLAGVSGNGFPFTLAAWRGERLVGAVSCERDTRVKVRHLVRLVGMMVDPAARGAGIGGALVAACVDTVQSRSGVEMLTLSVTSDNSAAIRLYERAGFVRYGRLDRAIRVGAIYYSKDLMVLRWTPRA